MRRRCPACTAYLEVLRADGRHVGDAQDEANGVEDVRFATAVQARDRVEALVPLRNHRPNSIRLEALQGRLDNHTIIRYAGIPTYVNNKFGDPHLRCSYARVFAAAKVAVLRSMYTQVPKPEMSSKQIHIRSHGEPRSEPGPCVSRSRVTSGQTLPLDKIADWPIRPAYRPCLCRDSRSPAKKKINF